MGKTDKHTYYGCANLNLIYNRMRVASRNFQSRSVEDLLTLNIWGRKQNIANFLINGFCFCSSFNCRYREHIYALVCSKEDLMQPFSIDSLRGVSYLDINIHKSLLPNTSDYILRDLLLLCMLKYPYETIEMMYLGALSELFELISHGITITHIDFKCRGICNTQAFCYYLVIIWAVNLNKEVKCLLGRDYTKLCLPSLLHSLCPEGCLHDRYLKGEITSSELYSMYIGSNRDVTDKSNVTPVTGVVFKEMLSVSTEGRYDGRDLTDVESSVSCDLFGIVSQDIENNINRGIGYTQVLKGTYTRLQKVISDQKLEIESSLDTSMKYKSKLDSARESLNKLKAEKSDLESEIISLRKRLSETRTDSELLAKVDELNCEICKLTNENNNLFNERLELKQLISKQKKDLRGLNSLTDDCVSATIVDEEVSNTDTVSDDNVAGKLYGLKCLTVGMEFNSTLLSGMESLGMIIKKFDKSTKSIGKYDIGIVFSSRCSHSDVYRLESLSRGTSLKVVYYGGSNLSQLIECILDALE